jgi:hypothetical protein
MVLCSNQNEMARYQGGLFLCPETMRKLLSTFLFCLLLGAPRPGHAATVAVTALDDTAVRWQVPVLVPGEPTDWQAVFVRHDADEPAEIDMRLTLSGGSATTLAALLRFELGAAIVTRQQVTVDDCDLVPLLYDADGPFPFDTPLGLTPDRALQPGETLLLCQRVTLSAAAGNALQGSAVVFDQSLTATGTQGAVLGVRDSGVAAGVVERVGTVLGARAAATGMALPLLPLGLALIAAAWRVISHFRYSNAYHLQKGGKPLSAKMKNRTLDFLPTSEDHS